jgi:hypothetical protein
MANLRKALVVSVMSITVLSMSMLAVPFKVGAAAQAGDLIKMDGLSSVYYLGADNKRYVFPNESTYFSWYSDFSSVVTIPQAELESYDLGANVTMRPGTKLVKITTSPKVYAVEKGGKLVTIPSEEVAKSLWGNDWAKRVVDVADAFFTNYEIVSGEVEADAYPEGSLVKFGGDDVYYIAADGSARKIDGEAAFAANRFQSANVVTATIARPSTGSAIDGVEATVADTAQKDLDVPADGKGLTVAVSSKTPASDNIPVGATSGAGAQLVPFTTFAFTASNDGAVVIEDLTLTRVGLGDESELSDAYLYAGDLRLTNGRSINSDNEVTFGNVNITVPAGSTKEITVRVNTLVNNDGMHAFEIKSASDVATDATVSGSFPVEGNTMSFTKINTGAVAFDLGSGAGASMTVGDDAEEVAEIKISETADREDVALVAITLENKGSADMDAFENFALYRKSVEIEADVTVAGDQVTFVLDTPYVIEEGEDEIFTVEADIVDGAGETFEFELDKMTDLVLVGQDYGFNVGVVATDNDVAATTIGNGDLTITEADSNPKTQDAAKDQEDVVFLVAELEAEEGTVSVEEIDVVVTLGGGATIASLENMVLKLDGKTVATDGTLSGTTYTFDEAFEVSGVQELTVLADFTDAAANGNYSVAIAAAGVDAENVDGDAITETGSAQGNAVTIGNATPTLSKDSTLGNKTIVAGDADFMAARFILEAGDAEDLEIENYTVSLTIADVDGTAELLITDIDNLYINSEDEIAEPTASNDFAVSETLDAGDNKVVTVYFTIDEDFTDTGAADTVKVSLAVDAEGAISGTDLSVSAVEGQTVTAGAGSLTLVLGANTPDATAVIAGSEVKAMELELEATNTGYDVTEMEISVYSAADETAEKGNVTEITIDGISAPVINGIATVKNLDIRIDKGEEVTVDVLAKTNGDFDTVDSADELYFEVTGYTYQADTDNTDTDLLEAGMATEVKTSNKLAIYNTLLTVATVAGDTVSLKTSDNDIMDIEVTADAADKGTLKAFQIGYVLTDDTVVVGHELALAATTPFELLDSNGDNVTITVTGTGATRTITLDTAETIAAGTTEVFTVRVNLAEVATDDSCEIQLLDTGFVWGDDEDAEGDLTGALIEDLSGTFEISK